MNSLLFSATSLVSCGVFQGHTQHLYVNSQKLGGGIRSGCLCVCVCVCVCVCARVRECVRVLGFLWCVLEIMLVAWGAYVCGYMYLCTCVPMCVGVFVSVCVSVCV